MVLRRRHLVTSVVDVAIAVFLGFSVPLTEVSKTVLSTDSVVWEGGRLERFFFGRGQLIGSAGQPLNS